jgi:hypothetical protein
VLEITLEVADVYKPGVIIHPLHEKIKKEDQVSLIIVTHILSTVAPPSPCMLFSRANVEQRERRQPTVALFSPAINALAFVFDC